MAPTRPDDDAAAMRGLVELNNELANTQRELARANADLRALDAEKNRMLGMVAHDLRNPLAVIAGYAETLEAGVVGAVDDVAREMLGHLHGAARRLQTMVDDLVDIAAIEDGVVRLDLAPFDLADVVDDALLLLRHAAVDKDIELRVGVAPATTLVADGPKLQQVVENLVGNAIKYSPRGTTVDVSAERDGGDVLLVVGDEGQGIAHADLPRLFEPFGTTSNRPTGGEASTGLGLAIVQRLVDAHGGTVSVESEVDVGSTFIVELPAAGPSDGAPAQDRDRS